MRGDLSAVRRRVERLATTVAAADDVSQWSDARLEAELLGLVGRFDPCSRCGYDLAQHVTEAANPRGVIDSGFLGLAERVLSGACVRCDVDAN